MRRFFVAFRPHYNIAGLERGVYIVRSGSDTRKVLL